MNAATEFDLGPLTWVKGEIDLALQRAEEASENTRRALIGRSSSFVVRTSTRFTVRWQLSGSMAPRF